MKYTKQITGNTGLYYVCYELSKRGWNVMPTSRNARGADIIAYSLDGRRMRIIEVISLKSKAAIFLDPFTISKYLIVCRNVYDEPECFIARINDTLKSKLIPSENKNGTITYYIIIEI